MIRVTSEAAGSDMTSETCPTVKVSPMAGELSVPARARAFVLLHELRGVDAPGELVGEEHVIPERHPEPKHGLHRADVPGHAEGPLLTRWKLDPVVAVAAPGGGEVLDRAPLSVTVLRLLDDRQLAIARL